MQQYEEMGGSPIIPACKHGSGTATKVSSCEYKSISHDLADSIVEGAIAASNQERGLRGMVDSSALPPETCGDKPVRYTCPVCGRRTCFSGLCTPCLERQEADRERTEAWHQGYRVDEHGDWRRI